MIRKIIIAVLKLGRTGHDADNGLSTRRNWSWIIGFALLGLKPADSNERWIGRSWATSTVRIVVFAGLLVPSLYFATVFLDWLFDRGRGSGVGFDRFGRYLGSESLAAFLVLLLIFLVGFIISRTAYRLIVFRMEHIGNRYCRSCEYDLTANVSGVCPECGTTIEP